MKIVTLVALASLTLLSMPSLSQAISLAPGQSGTPDSIAFPTSNDLLFYPPPGTAGAIPIPYQSSGAGAYGASVYQNSANGQLTFVADWDLSRAVPLTSIALSGYANVSVDASYASTSTYLPLQVSRSADGDVLTFSFSGNPTSSSAKFSAITELVIRTNATAFNDSLAALHFTDESYAVGAFAPNAPGGASLPEPASLALLPLALSALSLRLRQKR